MFNLHEVVFCISGDGKPWVGYVSQVFSDGDIIIRWFNKDTKQWHGTIKFKLEPQDKSVAVIGPLPLDVIFDDPDSQEF